MHIIAHSPTQKYRKDENNRTTFCEECDHERDAHLEMVPCRDINTDGHCQYFKVKGECDEDRMGKDRGRHMV